LRFGVRHHLGAQIRVGDGDKRSVAFTEDTRSCDPIYGDVDVDAVGEVGGKDLSRGDLGSLGCCCIRTEIGIEVGRESGGNYQHVLPAFV
jgi:hypothetical protein